MRQLKTRVTMKSFEEVTGLPWRTTHKNCHAAAFALVQSGVFPGSRVARGACRGVTGQHSWVVVGDDVYDETAPIVDPALWSYRTDVADVWYGTMMNGWHRPHGYGSIWSHGCPVGGKGREIRLRGLSPQADAFLRLCRDRSGGPMDRRFWMSLLNSPMQGWPSAEIVRAAALDDRLRALIPIDIVGMLTDLNPGEMYLPTGERKNRE